MVSAQVPLGHEIKLLTGALARSLFLAGTKLHVIVLGSSPSRTRTNPTNRPFERHARSISPASCRTRKGRWCPRAVGIEGAEGAARGAGDPALQGGASGPRTLLGCDLDQARTRLSLHLALLALDREPDMTPRRPVRLRIGRRG